MMDAIQDNPALLDKLNAGLKTAPRTISKELGQEQFFELMIAQLKNQDPTKPLDSSEYLGQLAQFGTVNGLQSLQKSFDQLANSLQSVHALQASSLVGRSVMIDGDSVHLSADNPLQGSVNLTDNVKDLTVGVYDPSGRLVRRIPLGDQPAGRAAFTWEGREEHGAQASPGLYKIRAEGMVNGKAYGFDTRVQAAVQSVTLGQGGQGMTLNLAGLGGRDINEVREIL